MQFLSLCLCHALYIHCTFMISDLYLVCQIWWINPTVHVHFQITTCLTPLLILAPLTEQCGMETNNLQSGVEIRRRPVSVLWISVQPFISQAEALRGSTLLSITPRLHRSRLSLMYTNIFLCKALQYQHVLEQKASWRLKNKSVHMCACARSHKYTLTVFVNATRDYSEKKGF